MLNALNLSDLIAEHLYGLVQQSLEVSEDVTTDTACQHVRSQDITTILKVCLCASVRVFVVTVLLLFRTWSVQSCDPPPLPPLPMLFFHLCFLSKRQSRLNHRETLWAAIEDAQTKPKRCVERKGNECQVCHLVTLFDSTYVKMDTFSVVLPSMWVC